MNLITKSIFVGAVISGLAIATLSSPAAAVSGVKHFSESAKVGSTAPAWTLPDTAGTSHSLSDYAGKIVVLEWTNHDCPYVKKHYGSGNMQALQKFATSHGVVWLSVVSSAKGREGYETPEEGQQLSKQQHSNATAKLLDPEGVVGHEYGAKTTPDIMIIDKSGTLVYSGGIDDQPVADPETIKDAHNYVRAALDDLFAGRSVKVSTSQPYGCSVKY